MRIRSTKPEFWRSTRIASVSWDARLVLKGLESYVDDNGVGKDDLELIVGDVFPRDLSRSPRDTLARVSEAVSHLHQAGLVWRYEAEGNQLLYLAFWESVQRIDKPGAGRLPRPDGTMNYKDSEIRESVASPREPSRLEQGNRGTGEQGNRGTTTLSDAPRSDAAATADPWLFSEFWKHYPRKARKDAARKAWNSAIRKANPDDIVAAADRLAQDPNLPPENFIAHPATWLNQGGWNDGPLPCRRPAENGPREATGTTRARAGMDIAQRLAQAEANQHPQIGA